MSQSPSFFESMSCSVDSCYIDLLEVPKYNFFLSTGLLDEYRMSKNLKFKWFSDIRYCCRVPIMHNYPSVESNVLESKRVQKIIDSTSESTSVLKNRLKQQAKMFFDKMRASFSKFLCKIASYVVFKIFRRISSRILVCPTQIKRLQEAEKGKIPILYLPLHRSHLDYFLITWSVWHWNIRLPHIASGNNLNLCGLGWLLRGFGAFFIRRRCNGNDENSSDELYRAVLNTYIIELLKQGLSIEFFLEGTRSRFGKTLPPKNGLVSNIVSAVREGEIADVLLVPVSISYDNTIEGVLLNELKGCTKKQENIFSVFRGIMTCFGKANRCGDIVVNYGTPVLLTERFKVLSENIKKHGGLFNFGHDINPNSYRELLPWQNDEDKILIRSVGYDLVYRAQQRKSISTSSLIAMLFVCQFRQNSVSLKRFYILLNELALEIQDLGYTLLNWKIDDLSSVHKGLSFLNDLLVLVGNNLDEQRLLNYPDDIFLQMRSYSTDCLLKLAYHKNGALAPFILISMSALAILSFCNAKPCLDECVQCVIELCNVLQFEVIFCSPCDDLKYKIVKALKFLNYDEFQNVTDFVNKTETSSIFCRPANENKNSKGARFGIHFYANILRPFLQTCFVVVTDLISRPLDIPLKDDEYIRNLIASYPKENSNFSEVSPEAINQDSIYNSIKILRLKGVLSNENLSIINNVKAASYARLFRLYLGERTENVAVVAAAS